ncbi:immunity 52 family protein [Pseudomonas fulva]|uniref:Imm52 family immunity protein n=1 Tax=Pseudomonas fulva TaxID=47880 RepID=UPI00201E36C2|nr:Imm52 family immunity protein [Pseudomonas fulva]UQY36813.1 immunity 52 family protein [Pseudomonas fulva]
MFIKFSFMLRFDKPRIAAISRQVQLERTYKFLLGLAEIHPILGDWFLQGSSKNDALSRQVINNPQHLHDEAQRNFDADFPRWLRFSLWNGQDDPLKGGLAFSYSAHDLDSMACMRFEDGGAIISFIPDVRRASVKIIQLALSLWPEIDWAVLAPRDHYLRNKTFKDRQTIGWIGFCPQALKASDFPDADELIDVPGRGTIVVSCPQVMDQDNLEHVQRVGNIDIKLMELGYLPMFSG